MKLTERISSVSGPLGIDRFGGKGYNLVILSQNGISVPNAFIICEEAFRNYYKSWFMNVDTNGDLEKTAQLIRSQFDKHDIDKDMENEIAEQMQELVKNSPLDSPLLAVRSSGIAEDLDNASFAGMNDTILNIPPNIHCVCNAIKDCWKSLFSERSIDYRVKHGFSPFDTSIAVIVQIMIPAEKAGVAFTADTQTGSRCHLSLDGVQGLGEALVSGMVNTDHWIIRKPYGKHSWYIEEDYIGHQEFKLVSNYPKEGTSRINLSEEESSSACFSKEELEEIVNASLIIERLYRKPMDIEFAFYNNQLYILQARPITHLLSIPDSVNPLLHPDSNEWRLFLNIGYFQMLTDPFTPIGYSTILHLAGVSSKYLLYVNGYLYMDSTGFIESWLFRSFTIWKFRTMVDEELAQIITEIHKKESSGYSHKEGKIAKNGIKNNFFLPMMKLLLKLYRQKHDSTGLEDAIMNVYEEVLAVEKQIREVGASGCDDLVQRVYSIPFDALTAICKTKGYMQFAFKQYQSVISLMKKNGMEAADAERLWKAPTENIANRYNNLIVRLGQLLKKKGLEENVRSLKGKEDVECLMNDLKTQKDEDSKEILRVWDLLMKDFGCRCHCEIDAGSPRYTDTPHRVLEMALNVADGEVIEEEAMKVEREEALKEVQKRVKPRVYEKIVELLPVASLFMKYREHLKYSFVRVLDAYHQALLTKGKTLKEKGVIERDDDVFNLFLEDLIQYEKGEVDGSSFKSKVKSARDIMNSAVTFTTPRVLCQPEGLMCILSKKTRDELKMLPENMLKGVPTSAGVVKGKAVVATDPHSTVLHKEEILVAKATDPSWTPLFSTAAAVVIEIGGPLTHGSVVAKELGIPCVVGIPGLMERIQNGMEICVDGLKGTIEILFCVY